uniref:Uncharacterized protein n=1 Tax=Metapenaeus joyneri majanivirus TaxID=2984280 RepID=A0A9C7BMK4_9VIRU|nr:MAG: hypothetical protein [Metapenaeus joyneri majanivirus]
MNTTTITTTNNNNNNNNDNIIIQNNNNNNDDNIIIQNNNNNNKNYNNNNILNYINKKNIYISDLFYKLYEINYDILNYTLIMLTVISDNVNKYHQETQSPLIRYIKEETMKIKHSVQQASKFHYRCNQVSSNTITQSAAAAAITTTIIPSTTSTKMLTLTEKKLNAFFHNLFLYRKIDIDDIDKFSLRLLSLLKIFVLLNNHCTDLMSFIFKLL